MMIRLVVLIDLPIPILVGAEEVLIGFLHELSSDGRFHDFGDLVTFGKRSPVLDPIFVFVIFAGRNFHLGQIFDRHDPLRTEIFLGQCTSFVGMFQIRRKLDIDGAFTSDHLSLFQVGPIRAFLAGRSMEGFRIPLFFDLHLWGGDRHQSQRHLTILEKDKVITLPTVRKISRILGRQADETMGHSHIIRRAGRRMIHQALVKKHRFGQIHICSRQLAGDRG